MTQRSQRPLVSSFRANLIVAAGALMVLAGGATAARAFPTYTGYFAGSCADCHGDFRAPTYFPPSRTRKWTDSFGQGALHGNHWLIASFNCDACHTGVIGVPGAPVFMSSSNGSGVGTFDLGCLGCHGRSEHDAGGYVTGAGLRRHHWNAGVPCTPCHPDSEPASGFTPVGEQVLPPNYAALGIDPCDNNAPEDFAGNRLGLDNDGDDFYDMDDRDCRRRRCGLGFELALILPPLAWLRRPRRVCPSPTHSL